MASLRLEPPASFPFSRLDEWQHWKRRFEQFRLTSGLLAEENPCQVSALLYCMGDEAEDTLASTNISEDDRKNIPELSPNSTRFSKSERTLSSRELDSTATVREKTNLLNNLSPACTI